ncbi:MAG: DEAD/DEAH box helicase family protein [Saprospiraceae bacterium]|nr:DEAD/DEAH box helicase family protein [Saprospiraceae bacterium]
MNSNFAKLPQEWQSLTQTAIEAEQQAHVAPMYAAVLCRKSLEEWIRYMYEHDGDLELPYDTSLNSLMHNKTFQDLIAPSYFPQLNTIRKLGNDAAHTMKRIKPMEAVHAVKLLHGFVYWVARIYGEEKVTPSVFDETLIPKGDATEKTKAELQKIEQAYLDSRAQLKKLTEELEVIKALKAQNIAQTPPPIDPNEALTRKIYIDNLLSEAGWDTMAANVVEYVVKGMPTANGKNDGEGRVDYVLWGNDGKPLAVVEAKRTSRDEKVGQHQAKLYADCLEKTFNQRPFIFYTNGFSTHFWDDTHYPPRTVFGFYTKGELQTLVNRRSQRHPLSIQPISNIADRYYQQEAIRATTETFEQNKREALLVMATGTGKTRTAAALIDLLSKAGWVKRVLFLADRNALIYQAQRNLNEYLPHLPAVDLTKEKEDESSRLVFSTYQTLMNLIDGEFEGDNRHFGVGYFDLIIFDEIHRSVYNRYKHIFKYFDGLKVGLTATPKSDGDKDTYALFSLEPGNPTYSYELEQAVSDQFLVPPRAISVPTKFQREGIKYAELSTEEKLEYEAQFADPITGALPNEINSTALNQWLFNIDTVDKVLGYLMQNGIKVEGGDKLGKTIIFARNHKHAMFVAEQFDKQYPHYKGNFLRVIDNQIEYRYDILHKFKDKDKMPQIAVSVDMLDTGIDVPEVVNLVFFKPVRSATKYWQMVGRGTRLCQNLFGMGEHKQHFVIFDFCENFEFFGENPKGAPESTAKSLSRRLFEIRLLLAQILRNEDASHLESDGEQYQAYSQALINILIAQTQTLEETNFIVRQHIKYVEKYRDANAWHNLSDLDIKEILEHIAPIVVETEEEETAKRFDDLSYQLQLFVYRGDKKQVRLIEQVRRIANKLVKKTSIPAVAQRLETLKKVQQDSYWHTPSVLGLERLRVELRDLIKFLEKENREIVITDYEDDLGESSEQAIVYAANDLEAYKRKVQHYLTTHQNHLAIHKLKMNIPITKTDLQELEKVLFEQGELGTKETFVKAYGEQPLGKFIRSIIGLDINAAKLAFSDVLNNQTFNAQQIRFMDTIVNYLSVKGTIELPELFAPPFTDFSPSSIFGLFDEATTVRIRKILDDVNGHAEAA